MTPTDEGPIQADAAARTRPRVAVLARGHEWGPAYLSLLEDLAGHATFDTFALFHATGGPSPPVDCPIITYQIDDMRSLGFEPDGQDFLYYCADLLLEHARRAIPDYDFYVMIEYDVEIGGDRGVLMAAVAAALVGGGRPAVDWAGPELTAVTWSWHHKPNAARFFDPVWASFFPIVVASHRAVQLIHQFRLDEGPRDLATDRRVICEALASLFVSRPGFLALDIKTLVPRSYDYWTFCYGLPMLLGVRAPGASEMRFRHPVYAASGFLKKHLEHAWRLGDLRPFLAALCDEALPIPDDVLAEYTQKARALLRQRTSRPFQGPTPLADPPGFILLVDDDDLAVRDRDAIPRSMTEVAGRPLFRHLIDRIAGFGARESVICLGFRSAQVRQALLDEFGGPEMDPQAVSLLGYAPAVLTVPARRGPGMRLHLLDGGDGPAERWRRAVDTLGGGRVVLISGNVWSDVSLRSLLATHQQGGKPVTLAVAQGCSIVLAFDEALRSVASYRPGLNDTRVEAGAMVLETGDLHALDQFASTSGGLLAALLANPRGATIHEHKGVCQTVNSAREAALFPLLARDHPDMFTTGQPPPPRSPPPATRPRELAPAHIGEPAGPS